MATPHRHLPAGCPVVVKGHPAHPGTSALAGDAIRDAVATCKLPAGVFTLLQGASNELGAALVADPRIKAVGFTGSRAGGLALVAIAQHRPEPIPVYAEMSSVNPVIILPAALSARAETIAKTYVGSLTAGAGQFCTNPGIVFAVESPALNRFITTATEALTTIPPQVMLTAAIQSNYKTGLAKLKANPQVAPCHPEQRPKGVVEGPPQSPTAGTHAGAALFTTDAQSFRTNHELAHEVFGASSLIVRCKSVEEIAACLKDMEGQLTATLQADEADHPAARTLLPLLETKVGRIPRQRLAHRRRSLPRDGPRRPVSRNVRFPHNIRRRCRDRPLLAHDLLPRHPRRPTTRTAKKREPLVDSASYLRRTVTIAAVPRPRPSGVARDDILLDDDLPPLSSRAKHPQVRRRGTATRHRRYDSSANTCAYVLP